MSCRQQLSKCHYGSDKCGFTAVITFIYADWKSSSKPSLPLRWSLNCAATAFSVTLDRQYKFDTGRKFEKFAWSAPLFFNNGLKGLCYDSVHVWALTVAECFWTNRKRVRCTQGNLHNSRFIVREAGVIFARFYISP